MTKPAAHACAGGAEHTALSRAAGVAALMAALLSPAGAVDQAALAARAVDRHILPGFEALATATDTLATTAADACSGPRVVAAYDGAFDAWMGVSHLRFGPLEEGETGFAIAFWPDARGATPRTLAALAAAEDPVVDDPAAFGDVSVAGRGLFALDALLSRDAPPPDAYGCRLIAAIALNLAATAARARDRWVDPYGDYVRDAGAAGNPLYFSPDEATRALYTAMLSGLEATADLRFGRPLGTFRQPQPRRAEAWRTGRPQRNAVLALEAVRGLHEAAFAQELDQEARSRVATAFAAALDAASDAGPIEVAVTEVGGRLRVEAAQHAVRRLIDTLAAEVGPTLGVAGGFNSMDGD